MLVLCLQLLLVLQGLHCLHDTDGESLPGHLQRLGAHMPPEQVRRVAHLPGPREFQENFVGPKTPVVFEGALKNSPVWRKWQDDDYIREHFGEAVMGIEQGKKENRSDPRYAMPVNKFLDSYKEEDIYMVDALPEDMYQEWQMPRPLTCGGFRAHFMYAYLWFSSGGTRSILHTDSSENFHCVVSGRKEFVLMEPHHTAAIGAEHARKGFFDVDVERVDMRVYPALSRIPWYQAVVHEGDCLYLPYMWIHNVNSYTGRSMAINIWWIPFDFNETDCPSVDTDLPEYFSLGDVELSPEMMVMEVLSHSSREDGSVHADELCEKMRTFDGMQYIEPHHVEEMLELLEPGCNGVISDYKLVPRSRAKEAFDFLMGPSEGDEDFDPQDEEFNPEMFDPEDEREISEEHDPRKFKEQEVQFEEDRDHHSEL